MATAFTDQQFDATIAITTASGAAGKVDGAPVWATSDATILTATAAADGMSAVIACVGVGTAHVTVTADADLSAGVAAITGVSEDIVVTVDPASEASTITVNLGPAVAKTPPAGP